MKNLSSRSPEVRETYQRYLIQDARTIRLFLSLLDRYPALKSFPLKPHDDVFSEAQGELVDIVFLATDRDVSRRRLMRLKPLCKDETVFESFQRELEDIYRRLSVAQGESATPTTLSQAL